MEEQVTLICKQSFSIANSRIVAFLKHQEEGLVKGLIIKSETSGKIWKIEARILSNHALAQHRIFENESVTFARMSFKNKEKRKISISNIVKEEAENIYQYLINPIEHNEKLNQEEKLVIVNKK